MTKPPIKSGYSGKFVLRVDPATHANLVERSRSAGVSLNSFCANALRDFSGFGRDPLALVSKLSVSVIGIVVFGSVARGSALPSSDEDWLIVLGKDAILSPSLYKAWDRIIAPSLPAKITPHFATLPDPDNAGSLWLEVAIEGKIIADSGDALHTALRKIRERILAGDYIRRFSHGHPYWIRKGAVSA